MEHIQSSTCEQSDQTARTSTEMQMNSHMRAASGQKNNFVLNAFQ